MNVKVETLTPFEVGKIIGTNAETVRAGLRAKRFDFGTAIPPQKEGGKWIYNIIASKVYEYANINTKEGEEAWIKKREKN